MNAISRGNPKAGFPKRWSADQQGVRDTMSKKRLIAVFILKILQKYYLFGLTLKIKITNIQYQFVY